MKNCDLLGYVVLYVVDDDWTAPAIVTGGDAESGYRLNVIVDQIIATERGFSKMLGSTTAKYSVTKEPGTFHYRGLNG